MKILGYLILVALLFPFGMYGAFLTSKLWNWFISPLFNVSVNLWQMWGILILAGLMNGSIGRVISQKREKKSLQEHFVDALTVPLVVTMVFFMGWIIHHFV